jgi:hypothetical protein
MLGTLHVMFSYIFDFLDTQVEPVCGSLVEWGFELRVYLRNLKQTKFLLSSQELSILLIEVRIRICEVDKGQAKSCFKKIGHNPY